MLSAIFSERAVSVPWSVQNDISWGVWPGDGIVTAAGVTVDERSAASLLAVYGSATFITDEVSTLPVTVDGAARPAWVDEPTQGLDRIAWLGQIMWSLLLSGNAYLAVVGDTMAPMALDPLDPLKVRVERRAGAVRYLVAGQPSRFPIVHIPGRMRPGDLVGMSPVEWARQSIGLGLAAQKYGMDWFDGEGNMPGVISVPMGLQPETMRQMAEQWRRKRRTGGKGLPGILQGGASWQPTGVTNEQAQFLQTRRYTAAEIAGQMFLLDPSDLGIPVEGTSLTYANLEQRNARRMQVALMPWIRRIESALSDVIPGGQYRFDVDSRLRGNTRESYETLRVALEAGFMTVAEVRDILGLERMDAMSAATPAELARILQMIYLSVGVVVSVDEARNILNMAGADLPAGFEQTVTFGAAAEDESEMRQRFIDLLERQRSEPPVEVHHHTHVNSPDVVVEPPHIDVHNRMESPSVTVHNDIVERAAEAPIVQVTVDPPPVNVTNEVNVEPTPVTIENEVNVEGRDAGTTTHRVFRDRNGNITAIESVESD